MLFCRINVKNSCNIKTLKALIIVSMNPRQNQSSNQNCSCSLSMTKLYVKQKM